jgi:hypothetical protein
MPRFIRCLCCNQRIVIGDDDVGSYVECPRTGRLLLVKPSDAKTGTSPPLPLPIDEPSRNRTWLFVTVGGVGLLLLVIVGFFAGKSLRETRRSDTKPRDLETAQADSLRPGVPPDSARDTSPVGLPFKKDIVRKKGPSDPAGETPLVPATVPVPMSVEADIKLLANDLKAAEPAQRIKALERIAPYAAAANIVGEQVVAAMEDTVPAVRDAAAETLEKVNPTVYPHVFTLIRGENKRGAITELGKLGDRARITLPLLFSLLAKAEADPTGPLGPLLTEVQRLPSPGMPPRAPNTLIDVIAQIAPKDRRLATIILDYVKTPRTRPAPAKFGPQRTGLGSKRGIGMRYLGLVDAGTADKVNVLVSALEDEADGGNVYPVITAIEGYGKDAAPALPLLKKMKLSSDDRLRRAATEAVKKVE